MGNRPSDRKKRESYEAVIDDQDGGLFGDALEDVPEVEEDPIFQMRKYTIHFRMMVLLPEFEVLRPGMTQIGRASCREGGGTGVRASAVEKRVGEEVYGAAI